MNVYIDGENYRHSIVKILRDNNSLDNLDQIAQFPLRKLLEETLDQTGMDVQYYAAKIKMPVGYIPSTEIKLQADDIKGFVRKLVPELKNQNIEYIKAGYLKVKSSKKCPKCGHVNEVLQEKGVDVRLSVDILSDAYNKKTDIIVIFSSDTDLIPALNKAKELGVKIVYFAYSESINRAISAVADSTVTFTEARTTQLFKESISEWQIVIIMKF